jgi:hypothetical protein
VIACGCEPVSGAVDIYAITSTVSSNGDQGADPNKLVKVTDLLKATTAKLGDGDHDKDDSWGHFTTIRSAKAGEVLRGVTVSPKFPHRLRTTADFEREN